MRNTHTNSSHSDRSKYPLFVIVGLSLALGGCSVGRSIPTLNGPDEGLAYYERFPIYVTKAREEVEIITPPHVFAISLEDKAAVQNLVASYKQVGQGSIKIVTPVDSPNEPASISAAAEITQVMIASGVDPHDIDVQAYLASSTDDKAPIIVRVERYKTATRPCGDWSETLNFNPDNAPFKNFGCATQSNLAAMVADPQDIAEPRELDAADPARRRTVFDKYRKGETTAVNRKDQESGTVSKVNNE